MAWKLLALILCVTSAEYVCASAFDQQLYEDVLDPKMCQQQLELLRNHNLRNQFIDASFRIPSGFLTGNINDLGDYHQCLGIDQFIEDVQIQGKYCTVIVPTDQDEIDWPNLPEWPPTFPPEWTRTQPESTLPDTSFSTTSPGTSEETEDNDIETTTSETTQEIEDDAVNTLENRLKNEVRFRNRNLANLKAWALQFASLNPKPDSAESRIFPATLAQIGMTLAVCVPKTCTPNQAIEAFQELAPFLKVSYVNYYCRLPNDKPFVPADYVAIVLFSFIGLFLGMSTMYDLYQTLYMKQAANPLLRSFSVYTNTRRLLTFKSSPGALECIDGVRSISMMWVIVGHTYSFTLTTYVHNMLDTYDWIIDFSSTWINAAPITVDTFFLLSGILVVYTTVGKISRGSFLRSLHVFYLNRLLRMFPLFAAVVLLQASLFNHMADGPYWQNVALATENCRKYWWSALLHVQNYVNPLEVCLVQSWYLSVDTQLYIVTPLVLWWLWGHPRSAWTALTFATLLSLVSSSLYSFLYNFSAALANMSRLSEFNDYLKVYYLSTLTRAPPFLIGMIYGYMLYVYKERKININRINVFLLWILSFLMMAFCVFSMYPVIQPDHTGQIFDNFLNAYMRAIWAFALGWLIFACVKGYGGPINWFLSLQIWKLPARLSYAMYLIHIAIILIGNGTWVKTHYFTVGEAFHRFAGDLLLSFGAAFILCVTIDAPCSTLQKLLLGGGKKRPQKPALETAHSTRTVRTENNQDQYIIKTSL